MRVLFLLLFFIINCSNFDFIEKNKIFLAKSFLILNCLKIFENMKSSIKKLVTNKIY